MGTPGDLFFLAPPEKNVKTYSFSARTMVFTSKWTIFSPGIQLEGSLGSWKSILVRRLGDIIGTLSVYNVIETAILFLWDQKQYWFWNSSPLTGIGMSLSLTFHHSIRQYHLQKVSAVCTHIKVVFPKFHFKAKSGIKTSFFIRKALL